MIAAALIGLAVLFRIEGEAVVPQPAANRSTAGSAASPPGMRLPALPHASLHMPDARADTSTGERGVGEYLMPGDDYAAMEMRLAPLADTDDNAALLLHEAASLCARAVPPDWRRRAGMKQRVRTVLAWKERFCGGRTTSAENEAYAKVYMAGVMKRMGAEGDDTVEADSTVFYDTVFRSNRLDELGAASSLLEVGDTPWPFARDLVVGTRYEPRIASYQRAAIDDLSCGISGGCGPGGMRTATLCLTNLAVECLPGRSVADMWAEQFSPPEIAIIREMERRILGERARRAGAPTGTPGPPARVAR
ncbi:MAG: hypothetical protein ABWX83_00365 [Luteibacter sp.]